MDFRELTCEVCGKEQYAMSMDQTATGWKCYRDCRTIDLRNYVVPPSDHEQDFYQKPAQPHPLAKEFGFDRPEDGSERRYRYGRFKQASWQKRTFWWVVHNAVAHPMIGFVPCRLTFTFHDYTSRKMHQA